MEPFFKYAVVPFTLLSLCTICLTFVYIKKNVFVEKRVNSLLIKKFFALYMLPDMTHQRKNRGTSQCRFPLGYFKRPEQSHRLISYFEFPVPHSVDDLMSSIQDIFSNKYKIVPHPYNQHSFALKKKTGKLFVLISVHVIDTFKIRITYKLISPKFPVASL